MLQQVPAFKTVLDQRSSRGLLLSKLASDGCARCQHHSVQGIPACIRACHENPFSTDVSAVSKCCLVLRNCSRAPWHRGLATAGWAHSLIRGGKHGSCWNHTH
eukprot:1157619-Pelagomonas_calceolata.AAC.3